MVEQALELAQNLNLIFKKYYIFQAREDSQRKMSNKNDKNLFDIHCI